MNIKAPYIRTGHSVPLLMGSVVAASFFITAIASLCSGSASSFLTFAVCIFASAVSEMIYKAAVSRTCTILDFSAVVTGSILAVIIPPSTPLWLCGAAAAIAILAGKQIFGGLGRNIFNPALVGLLASAAAGAVMRFHTPSAAGFTIPSFWINGQIWSDSAALFARPVLTFGLFGKMGLAALPAAVAVMAFLYVSGIIRIEIPLMACAGAAAVSFLLQTVHSAHASPSFYFLASGGFVFLSSVVAADPVTSPLSAIGRALYGFICGIAVALTAMLTAHAEAAILSLLVCNAFVPGINRLLLRR